MRNGICTTHHQQYKLIILVVSSTGVAKPPSPQWRKGELVRISSHSGVVRGPSYEIQPLESSVLYSTGVTDNIRPLEGVSSKDFILLEHALIQLECSD